MSLVNRAVQYVNRYRFERAARTIRRTPAITLAQSGPVALSMVQHRDVDAYLLALKSFVGHMPVSRVVVVADPTLSAEDRSVFREHVPNIEIRDAKEFQRPGIPRGGCWERLSAISDYVAQESVVQLDADTMTIGPVPEVGAAVQQSLPFTLGTEDQQSIETCAEISARARTWLTGTNDHVQVIAESLVEKIEGAEELRYARGCAGFAGYPRGSFDFARLRGLSERMSRVMGDRWAQWGTEQFTSNLLLASMPGFRLLPHPKYCAPHRRKAHTVFLHFIGYVRFTTPLYARVASSLVRDLQAGP